MECRIYAEDPENNFFPSPGKILDLRAPSGPGIRMDDGVYSGWTVPTDYDPMLGKLIAWGSDRAEAIARLQRALGEYYARGIRTNVALFRRILSEPEFLRAEIHTKWLDELLSRRAVAPAESQERTGRAALVEDAAALAAALWHANRDGASSPPASGSSESPSNWKIEGRQDQLVGLPRRK